MEETQPPPERVPLQGVRHPSACLTEDLQHRLAAENGGSFGAPRERTNTGGGPGFLPGLQRRMSLRQLNKKGGGGGNGVDGSAHSTRSRQHSGVNNVLPASKSRSGSMYFQANPQQRSSRQISGPPEAAAQGLEKNTFMQDIAAMLEEEERAEDPTDDYSVTKFHMIGEIRPVNMRKEGLRMARYAVVGALLLVASQLLYLIKDTEVKWQLLYLMKDTEVKWQGMPAFNWALFVGSGMPAFNWALFVGSVVVAQPLFNFLARLFAYLSITSTSRILFRFNALYFVVALHQELTNILVFGLLLAEWEQWIQPLVIDKAYSAVHNTILCLLAAAVAVFLRNFTLLLIASTHLWLPYLERTQSSIFAQYVLLILTEYCSTGIINAEFEALASQIAAKTARWSKLSLYAVYKSVSFVQHHKVGGSVFKELGLNAEGDGGEDTIDNSRQARALGEYLYKRLGDAARAGTWQPPYKPPPPPAAAAPRRAYLPIQSLLHGHLGSKSTTACHHTSLQSHHASSSVGGDSGGGGGGGGDGSGAAFLLLATPPLRRTASEASLALSSPGSPRSRAGTKDDGPCLSPPPLLAQPLPLPLPPSVTAAPLQPQAPPPPSPILHGLLASLRRNSNVPAPQPAPPPPPQQKQKSKKQEGTPPTSPPPLTPSSPSSSMPGAAAEAAAMAAENAELPNIELAKFCPAMSTTLRPHAFALFDKEQHGVVTKDDLLQGVVSIYKDHKNLARTLADSQQMVNKLGQIIGALMSFVMIFIWLSIWGYQFLSISITFSSFLLSFTFMFGSTATALVESIIFVFVTSAYDVGDRLMIPDIMQTSRYHGCKVVKINLLTTVFERGDGQSLIMPNKLLSQMALINLQRSGNMWFEFVVGVSATTPLHKLHSLKGRMQKFANEDSSGIYHKIGFTFTEIQDSAKLVVRINVQGRFNWGDVKRRWEVHNATCQAIAHHCAELGITFTPPVQHHMVKLDTSGGSGAHYVPPAMPVHAR
ncbi:Mechanosensitive ion channel-domain-containing protein [Tribonema minus]|uniref:Mechanosensitive ion channel-domain-containing protein n=1 Tax=Tribonema minus TaxID=303371 RepID=A0A835Z0M4_9STRA|nr:Mechanosensitive ion channel-domain-containing protein [Tribonema minus]